MAKYVHGINGPLVGRLGNLVASSWRNIPYLKTRPQRKKPFTRNELANQGKFGGTSRWLSPLKDFLRAGFKGDDPRKWGFNGAKSYLHKHAMVRLVDQKVIDPSKVLISQGDLPLAEGFAMHFDHETGEITVRWDPKLPKGRKGGSAAAANDKLMLAVYSPEEADVWGEPYGASRRAGIERTEVHPDLVTTYHVYVAFVAADGSSRSDSLYLGAIEVGEERKGEEGKGEEEYLPEHERMEARRSLIQRSPVQPARAGNGSEKHRWQSSTSSTQAYRYTFTYSYASGHVGSVSEAPPADTAGKVHKNDRWFPKRPYLNT